MRGGDGMPELKPCPLCGGKVKFNYNIDFEPDSIACNACHMFVRFSRIRVKGNEKFEVVLKKMAEAWNRRANAGTA